jgi:hypothetical protein
MLSRQSERLLNADCSHYKKPLALRVAFFEMPKMIPAKDIGQIAFKYCKMALAASK